MDSGTVSNEIPVSPPGGRAMLRWEGRTVPSSVVPGSAQLVEVCDPRVELPLAQLNLRPSAKLSPQSFLREALPNCLYHGDNLPTLGHLLANGWRNRFRLIYIDPPFDSGGDFVRKVRLRNARRQIVGEKVEYRDIWHDDSYLQFIFERLLVLRELLAEDGAIWLHCDYRQVHRLRLLMEEVFGEENYLNTISWRSQVARGAKVRAFYFPFSTQYIVVFAKNRQAPTYWNPQRRRLVFSREEAAAQFMEDELGFFRTSDPGTYSFERLKALHEEGRLYAPFGGEIMVDEERRRVYPSNGGNIGVKYYLSQMSRGRFSADRGVDNLWDDIPGLGTTPGEDVGYPTQKTEALMQRIVSASTQAGDWVLDCFGGSGTTAAVAQKMGRRWILCDDSYGAIQTTRRRLQQIVHDKGPGFVIYRGDTVPVPQPLGDSQQRVDLEIQRVDSTGASEICVRSVRIPDQTDADDWRAWVDAVEIDPDHDGEIFRCVLADVPPGRRDQVAGAYPLTIATREGRIAVRITDVYGREYLVKQ